MATDWRASRATSTKRRIETRYHPILPFLLASSRATSTKRRIETHFIKAVKPDYVFLKSHIHEKKD